jgi:hypothetical protein
VTKRSPLLPRSVTVQLGSAHFSASLKWLQELHLPTIGRGQSLMADASPQEYGDALFALLSFWSRIGRDNEYWSLSDGEPATLVTLTIGRIAIDCLERLFASPDAWDATSAQVAAGLRALDWTPSSSLTNPNQMRCLSILASLSTCIAAGLALESLMRGDQPVEAIGLVERKAHKYGADLAYMGMTGDPSLSLLAATTLLWYHQNWQRIYGDLAPRWNSEYFNPYPPMRLGELDSLSRRTPSVVARYGKERLAGRFEQQLAMLASTLGCVVVQTRRFERSVDIVCFSETPKATFLIEAKTTAGPYSLPTKDERALAEYVETVREGLRFLPSLQLVIIVGPDPTGTLGPKLRRLSLEIGVPIRFLRAGELARARQQIAGSFPLSKFLKCLKEDSEVIDQQTISTLIQWDRTDRQRFLDLVNLRLSW